MDRPLGYEPGGRGSNPRTDAIVCDSQIAVGHEPGRKPGDPGSMRGESTMVPGEDARVANVDSGLESPGVPVHARVWCSGCIPERHSEGTGSSPVTRSLACLAYPQWSRRPTDRAADCQSADAGSTPAGTALVITSGPCLLTAQDRGLALRERAARSLTAVTRSAPLPGPGGANPSSSAVASPFPDAARPVPPHRAGPLLGPRGGPRVPGSILLPLGARGPRSPDGLSPRDAFRVWLSNTSV